MATEASGSQRLDSDVVVVGGGPAGAWAALAARASGAEHLVLVDKGADKDPTFGFRALQRGE